MPHTSAWRATTGSIRGRAAAISTGSRPAGGIYQVEIHYWGQCSISGGGPTNVTVSVAVGREIAGQYSQSLLPGERVRVLRFVVQ